jgi:hypothetical protein
MFVGCAKGTPEYAVLPDVVNAGPGCVCIWAGKGFSGGLMMASFDPSSLFSSLRDAFCVFSARFTGVLSLALPEDMVVES